MAISRRGNATSVVDNRGANTLAIPVPAGVAAGDLLVAVMGTIAFAPTTSQAPAGGGWVKVGERNNAGTDNTTSYVYKKVVTGAEAASYTWTFGNNGRSVGGMVAYVGTDTAADITGAVNGWVDPPAANQSPAIGVNAGDWLLTYAFGRQSPGDTAVKSWSNGTAGDLELFDLYNNDGASRQGANALWDSNGALPSSSVQRTVTSSPALQQVHLWSLRIPVLATGGGADPTPPTGVTTWTNLGIPIR